MMHRLWIFIFVSALMMPVSPSGSQAQQSKRAQTKRVQNDERLRQTVLWKKVLKGMQITGKNRLDENDLVTFMVSDSTQARIGRMIQKKADELSPYLTIQPKDLLQLLEDEANMAMNSIDCDGDDYIDQTEVDSLLAYTPGIPFVGTIGDLLGIKPEKTKESLRLDVIDRWVRVRRSYLDSEGIGKPATISYSYKDSRDETGGEAEAKRRNQTVWDIHAAVSLEPKTWKKGKDFRAYITPIAVFEPSYTTGTKDNTFTHRVGLTTTTVRGDARSHLDHWIAATYDLVTTNDYIRKMQGLTVQASPNWQQYAIGGYVPIPLIPAYFRWRPYISYSRAWVRDEFKSKTLDDFDLLTGRLAFELWVQSGVNLKYDFSGTVKLHKSGQEDYHVLSVLLPLDEKDRVSIQASYEHGRNVPEFKHHQKASLALGFKL